MPDAAWAGSPIARIPFEPEPGRTSDPLAGIDRMPTSVREPVADPKSFMSPMDARRESDIDAFLSGAPMPPAPTAQPVPLPNTAPTPVRRPDAPDPLRSFSQPRPVGEPPTQAPPYRFGSPPDFATRESLPGMQQPNARIDQREGRDRALLDFWAKERADRPALPEQAPEPRTYAEAQALHPRYRGNLDPEAVAKLPGAPKPAALPRNYAEGSVMPPEQRADVLSRFAALKEKHPAGDEVWGQFLSTLPGAPKPVAQPSEMDRAKLANEQARLDLIRAQTERAGRPSAAPAQRETPEDRRAEQEEARIRAEDRARAAKAEEDARRFTGEYAKTNAAQLRSLKLINEFNAMNPGDQPIEGTGTVQGRVIPDMAASPRALKNRATLRLLGETWGRGQSGAAIGMTEEQRFAVQSGTKETATDQEVRIAMETLRDVLMSSARAAGVSQREAAQEVANEYGVQLWDDHAVSSGDPSAGRAKWRQRGGGQPRAAALLDKYGGGS